MVMVLSFPLPVHPDVSAPIVVGDIESCRPKSCPHADCGKLARDERDCLRIRGHGSYERQVLGLAKGRPLRLLVRRYLCAACKRTINVLPSWVYPWRWYAAPTMVEVLWRLIVLGESAASLCRELALWPKPYEHWKTLVRWVRDFLVSMTLYGWLGTSRARAASAWDRLHRFLFGQCSTGPVQLEDWTPSGVGASAQSALIQAHLFSTSAGRGPVTSGPSSRTASPTPIVRPVTHRGRP